MRAFIVVLTLLGGAGARPASKPKILFLTHSAGFVHSVVKRPDPASLAHAEKCLIEAAKGKYEVVATQDCAELSKDKLVQYAAVVFYTTGELPIDADALVAYVKGGGGFVGIHCATDTLYKHAGFGEMIGGRFDNHPWHQKVKVRVEDKAHPSTKHLGESFEITDEIYQFRDWERSRVRVLLSLDVASVNLGAKGVNRQDKDFAVSWTRRHGDGRVFYTSLGHREEVWKDERFMKHLLEGIDWTLGPRPADGFEPIFDAEQGDGWKMAGPGGFKTQDGVATPHGGMGLWWYSKKSYKNFILKLEFNQEHVNANSGVFVRFPDPANDPWIAVNQGYEVQIAGDKPSKNSTGAVYSFKAADEIPLRAGWNDYEITCIGHEYHVRLNGRLINSYTGERQLEGFVGLQNHDDKSIVRYRNIRVKELPAEAAGYHVLFDGREPKGWKMAGPGELEFKDGFLTTRGGMGLFWHEQEFGDFILMLDWKVSRRKDNSGVFVRFPDPGNDPWVAVNQGYEIQICDVDPAKHRTGSVYSLKDSSHIPTLDVGEWNAYEIRAIGQKYEIWVNGEKVNEFTGDRGLKGRIGVQNHDAAAAVSFRNVRVVSLKGKKEY